MQSDKGWVAGTHRKLYDSIYGETHDSYSSEQRKGLLQEANRYYTCSYRNPLIVAISSAMPNIEVITWKEPYLVDETFFPSLDSLPLAASQAISSIDQGFIRSSTSIKSPNLAASLTLPRSKSSDGSPALGGGRRG